jgi:hypothetical protein
MTITVGTRKFDGFSRWPVLELVKTIGASRQQLAALAGRVNTRAFKLLRCAEDLRDGVSPPVPGPSAPAGSYAAVTKATRTAGGTPGPVRNPTASASLAPSTAPPTKGITRDEFAEFQKFVKTGFSQLIHELAKISAASALASTGNDH